MKTLVTFGQSNNHIHRINNLVFDKNCVAVVNGDEEKVKEVFGKKYSMAYLESNFDYNSIEFFPRGYIAVPDEIIIKITIDPLSKYNHLSQEEIFDTLGALPHWAINPDYLDVPLKEALDKQYNFGLYESSGQTITKEGIYQYPEDPDLYPLIKIQRKDEIFYQYRYAIIAIVQKDGSWFASRMD